MEIRFYESDRQQHNFNQINHRLFNQLHQMKTEPNENANPQMGKQISPNVMSMGYSSIGGLTKREYFSAKALQGLLASRCPNAPKLAVEYADELINELNK